MKMFRFWNNPNRNPLRRSFPVQIQVYSEEVCLRCIHPLPKRIFRRALSYGIKKKRCHIHWTNKNRHSFRKTFLFRNDLSSWTAIGHIVLSGLRFSLHLMLNNILRFSHQSWYILGLEPIILQDDDWVLRKIHFWNKGRRWLCIDTR